MNQLPYNHLRDEFTQQDSLASTQIKGIVSAKDTMKELRASINMLFQASESNESSIIVTNVSNFDFEGGEDGAEEGDPEDIDNIDFNNYKGIYADDDAGQKYTCPETGAHFEPKDLCKRIYRVVEKRKPHELQLYGQPMLLDLVGSSLLADAPYAQEVNQAQIVQKQSSIDQGTANNNKKTRVSNFSQNYQKSQNSTGNGQMRQTYQVPNARAGSMKQP